MHDDLMHFTLPFLHFSVKLDGVQFFLGFYCEQCKTTLLFAQLSAHKTAQCRVTGAGSAEVVTSGYFRILG